MTEIEDKLTRVLAAEADRHEPPTFNAHRIAAAAMARRRFGRRRLFALIAAVIGTAGAGGAAVLANGGGQHRHADMVTITFQNPDSIRPPGLDAAAKAWVRNRAAAVGLKDVTATVGHHPWQLQVTGHAADLDLLKTFGEPGILQFRPVVPVPPPAPFQSSPTHYCQVTLSRTGTQYPACGRDGAVKAWVTDPVGSGYSVVAARALPVSRGGPGGDVWRVMVTLDAIGTEGLAGFTARSGYYGKTTALMVDGAVADTQDLPLITDGELDLAAGSTAAQARLLAEILSTQGPEDLVGATMTVSTR